MEHLEGKKFYKLTCYSFSVLCSNSGSSVEQPIFHKCLERQVASIDAAMVLKTPEFKGKEWWPHSLVHRMEKKTELVDCTLKHDLAQFFYCWGNIEIYIIVYLL